MSVGKPFNRELVENFWDRRYGSQAVIDPVEYVHGTLISMGLRDLIPVDPRRQFGLVYGKQYLGKPGFLSVRDVDHDPNVVYFSRVVQLDEDSPIVQVVDSFAFDPTGPAVNPRIVQLERVAREFKEFGGLEHAFFLFTGENLDEC